jgi:hypothetical protein
MILPLPRRLAVFDRALATASVASLIFLLAMPAFAQTPMIGGTPSQNMSPSGAAKQFGNPKGNGPAKPEIQPDALPGAKATTPVAPATKSAADMSPNDALFDAINRGDIAAARDALNRGADLSAHNILGMTPMDLSVDLGRNDISFLLLSMRSEDKPASGAPTPSGSAAGSAAGAQAALTAKQPAAKGPPATKPAKVAQTVPAPQVPMAPRLFANDGGTPNPAVGFLGFDPSRSPR